MLKPTIGPNAFPYGAQTGYHPKEGAYYYASGGSVSTYKKASAIIILPSSKKQKGTGLGRNAYISFGIDCGSKGGIDIGLLNRTLPDTKRGLTNTGGDAGLGWEAICLECFQDKAHYFDNQKAPVGTKRVKLEVEPNLTSPNFIRLSVQWLDENNRVIDASKNINTSIELNQRYSWNKFYRFASLVTGNTDVSLSDSTYMIGGEFTNTKIGNANWGIGTGTVERSWIISHPKCQLPDGYWDTGEQFRIDHWA